MRPSPGTRFRITPCTRVHTTAVATAVASGSVLRTPAVSSSALTATQSPWRLPSAGSSGADSPSLIPHVLPFLTAYAGSDSHTPRIPDAGGAIRTLGPQLSAQLPPSTAAFLLDRAYVAPIHALHPVHGYTGLRLSCTDTRAVHASRRRNTDRYTTDMRE